MQTDQLLLGRSALVTGAGRGIGREEALYLAKLGAQVMVNDVDTDLSQEVVNEITAAGGSACRNNSDIATWAGAEEAVSGAVREFGQLDVLVNNAGIIRDTMSFSMNEEQWDDVIRVHLKGHAACAHFAGCHWRDRSKAGESGVSGRIVNTASESGLYGLAGQINYASAKAGIAAMTVVLARELHKYGVTVNAIAPRARTRMTESVLGSLLPEEGAFDEWDPANIAPVVAWLASDQSNRITGQVFVVNGDKVHLMSGWHRVGRIENAGCAWTVDDLQAKSAELFGEHSTGRPAMGFGE
ncbi:MAG: SDR family NAD(P)-dependent oxidoreductase [Actinobacteria bacterium]|nr:SDR family NAD(P)-dependent oxidoreductase [Actinomycetota bacterium]